MTYLAREEIVDTLPSECGTLDSLVVDGSGFLFAETRDLGSGSLGEVLVVRLGDLLGLLLDGSSGSDSSLALGNTPSTITLNSGGLGSVVLVLSILLALLLG